MKILMLTDRMDIGGAETHVFDLIRALLKKGHRVCLLCGGGRYAELLIKEGVQVSYAPLHKRGAAAVARAALALRRVYGDGDFDLIHAHTRYTARLSRTALPKAPLCVTAHLPFTTHGWHRLLCHWGDATLAVSTDIGEYLVREYGVPISQIFPTRNGIDATRFRRMALTEQAIVHVSRLDEGRAACAEALLKIAPRLLSEHPEYTVRIVGDGNRMERIRALAGGVNATLGREAVILTGAVSKVSDELRRGNIFVGVSRALLEAMSVGLPAVLAGDEGFGGIVHEQRFKRLSYSNFCGRECPPLSEEALYESLDHLMRDEDLRGKLGESIPRITKEEYSTERMAEDALDAYRYLLGKSVLVIGYYGYGNLGDELTLSVLTAELQKRGVRKITVVGRRGEECAPLRFIGKGDFFRIRRAMRGAERIIFGGGNLLQNETSNRSLYYYGTLLKLARRYGKRMIMMSAGVGRVVGYRQIRYTENLLSLFDEIYLRTAWDVRLAREVYHAAGARYAPDLVFRLPSLEGSDGREGREGNKRCEVGIVLHGGKAWEGWASYLEALALRNIRLHYIVLFPDKDLAAVTDLATRFRGGISIATDLASAREAFLGCRYTVSERLHGGILSLIFGVKCYLREDLGKCTALAGEIEALGRRHGVTKREELPLLSFREHSELPLLSFREHSELPLLSFGEDSELPLSHAVHHEHQNGEMNDSNTEDGTAKDRDQDDGTDGTPRGHKKSEPDENIGFAKWINWILKESVVDPFASFD